MAIHPFMHVAAKNGHAKAIERIIHCCPDSGELLDVNGRSVLNFSILSRKQAWSGVSWK
jgi:hypothetical protein